MSFIVLGMVLSIKSSKDLTPISFNISCLSTSLIELCLLENSSDEKELILIIKNYTLDTQIYKQSSKIKLLAIKKFN